MSHVLASSASKLHIARSTWQKHDRAKRGARHGALHLHPARHAGQVGALSVMSLRIMVVVGRVEFQGCIGSLEFEFVQYKSFRVDLGHLAPCFSASPGS